MLFKNSDNNNINNKSTTKNFNKIDNSIINENSDSLINKLTLATRINQADDFRNKFMLFYCDRAENYPNRKIGKYSLSERYIKVKKFKEKK